jgi:hypothetical protein
MIPVQDAVRTAGEYLNNLFPDARDMRLEEVEVDEKGAWDVTLSYWGAGAVSTSLSRAAAADKPAVIEPSKKLAIGIDPSRTFKVVSLDRNGVVKAVRIRPIVVG